MLHTIVVIALGASVGPAGVEMLSDGALGIDVIGPQLAQPAPGPTAVSARGDLGDGGGLPIPLPSPAALTAVGLFGVITATAARRRRAR